MYGKNILSDDNYIKQLRKIANIEYKGPYDGFEAIPQAPYAAYLHTAYWEGLPNTLLEAMGAGILVVAPDVGGIGEVIKKDKGVLIKQHQSPSEYVDSLKKILDNPADYQHIADKGQRYIAKHYNKENFLAQIKSVPGYFATDSIAERRFSN